MNLPPVHAVNLLNLSDHGRHQFLTLNFRYYFSGHTLPVFSSVLGLSFFSFCRVPYVYGYSFWPLKYEKEEDCKEVSSIIYQGRLGSFIYNIHTHTHTHTNHTYTYTPVCPPHTPIYPTTPVSTHTHTHQSAPTPAPRSVLSQFSDVTPWLWVCTTHQPVPTLSRSLHIYQHTTK